MSSRHCVLCPDTCEGADLAPLLSPDLLWLWHRLAAVADRRGDVHLIDGTAMVTAPTEARQRAAALGLLAGRPLVAGRSRRVDLAALTEALRVRGPKLTPGSVAAHATHRELGVQVRERSARAQREAQLAAQLTQMLDQLPSTYPRGDVGDVWSALRRAGWAARITDAAEPARMLTDAIRVIGALPTMGSRVDRRQLADQVLDDPHGLDDGTPTAGLVLALLTALSILDRPARPRDGWDNIGVDYDDLTGGLLSVGIYPAGWQLPPDAAVTVPPRELARCTWPGPSEPDSWVFVTENPSILGAVAAATTADGQQRRLICTSGTPSAREISAVARVAAVGWRVAVRADFDAAGIGHVRALLSGIPGATPWRMSNDDYIACLSRSPQAPALTGGHIPATEWEPPLADAMRFHGRAGYEESLMAELVGDVTRGRPERG